MEENWRTGRRGEVRKRARAESQNISLKGTEDEGELKFDAIFLGLLIAGKIPS